MFLSMVLVVYDIGDIIYLQYHTQPICYIGICSFTIPLSNGGWGAKAHGLDNQWMPTGMPIENIMEY
jgi:hypothetical protein